MINNIPWLLLMGYIYQLSKILSVYYERVLLVLPLQTSFSSIRYSQSGSPLNYKNQTQKLLIS